MLHAVFAFLHRHRHRGEGIERMLRWTPRLVLAAMISVFLVCAVFAWLSRDAVVHQARASCTRSLDVAREHVSRVIEDAGRTVNSVIAWLRRHPNANYRASSELLTLGESLNLDPTQTRAVAIIDRKGLATLLDRTAVNTPVDVSGRPYMEAMRSAELDRLSLGPPATNMTTGAETISVFSKIIDAEGNELIITTAFSTQRMRALFASLAGIGGALELRDSSQTLLSAPAEGHGRFATDGVETCETTIPAYNLSLRAAASAELQLREWWLMVLIGTIVLAVFAISGTILTALTLSLLRTLQEDSERLERLLDQANQSAQAKSIFLATMSHELRTPLNAIVGFVETMRLGVFGRLGHEKYDEYCVDILNAASSVIRTYDDVLLAAKTDTSGMEVVRTTEPIRPLFEELMRLFSPIAQARQIELQLILSKHDEGTCSIDKEKVARALRNLIENSLKYCRAGDRIIVHPSLSDDGLRVEVADTGPGMEMSSDEEVFGMFHQAATSPLQASPSGVGLGMWLVRRIVEAHGGTVTVTTRPGQGFRTVCTFPSPKAVRTRLPEG